MRLPFKPHMSNAEKGGHHIWMLGPELQGLTNYKAKDLLSSSLALLWDDKQAHPPDVEKTLYTSQDEAWKE
jgi:hypothetical protein